MNIYKHKLKAVSVMLCIAIIIGSFWSANATEATVSGNVVYVEETGNSTEWTEGESRYEDVEVTYNQASSYRVTIPKTIVLGADKSSSYSIKVEGDIAANEQVCVVPVDGIGDTEVLDFYMHDQTEGSTKDVVPAEINQSKFYWDSSEAAASYEETDNHIVAEGLSAGSWKGIFQIEISLRIDTSHIHNYIGTVTKEPTCTEAGEKTYTCDCGDSYTEAIDAKGHNYKDGECTDCGEKDSDHVHSYVESITKEPTCTEEGEKTYTCGCGNSYTEVIPAKGHHYENGECTNCGDKNPDHEHSYTESITKEPTCTEAGEKTYTCDCGNSYTEEIPATGKHDYVDGTCTDCGAVEDPYAVGSNQDLMYWYYKLDETDNTVTLTKFKGGTANPVAYSSYELNGKVYGTKIGNAGANYSTGLLYNAKIATVAFGNNIDFSDTTNMNYMFMNCSALKTIDFGSNFDTSNVTSMASMFQNCKELEDLDVSSFDTSNVTSMISMFNYCKMLKGLDVSSFDTGNVTSMKDMFRNCDILESINVSNFNTGNVTDMDGMFSHCPLLTDINIENFDTHNVESMCGTFADIGMERIDISKWDTGKVKTMSDMFGNSKNLTYVDMGNLNLSSIINFQNMFYNCSSLECVNLENIRLRTANLNRGESFKMNMMFMGCTSLEELDLSSWDTNKVTDMQQMFCDCINLKKIYVDRNLWKTAYTSGNMFYNCGTNTVTYK